MFKPTQRMIDAANAVFVAMAAMQLIEPIVLGYQTEILAKHQWRIRPQWRERLGDKVVTDPKQSYLLSEEDFAVFDAECKAARNAANLYVEKDDQCPLCVAEVNLINAQARLMDSMAHVTNLSWDKCRMLPADKRAQAIELTLQLLGPYVK